jgi:hypothetical protein
MNRWAIIGRPYRGLFVKEIKAAGDSQPPSKVVTGPNRPQRSVCALKVLHFHCTAHRLRKEIFYVAFIGAQSPSDSAS